MRVNVNYILAALVLVALLLGLAIYEYSSSQVVGHDTDVLYQSSTINALLEGVYDGDVTFTELRRNGDVGLGTFNGLDGEMIGVEGEFYQIKVDGVAYPVNDSMRTPFAVVTFFEPDETVMLYNPLNYTELKIYLDDSLPTENIFYAIKIEGKFEYIKTRSVPPQHRPYPPLVEVIKDQSIFHFITEDRRTGGHLLECQLQNVNIEIDFTSDFHMVLPESNEFYEVHLAKEEQTE
jgi:acetolactate decarboxylase